MSNPSADASADRAAPASPLAECLTWSGLILVLAPMLFRAMTQVSTLPYWDMDPLISWSPLVGIGPAGSLLVDALIILGAGVLLIGTARHARSAWFLLAALLVSIGCVPIAYHGWSSTVFTLGQQRVGASWAAAMIAGLALWQAGADRRVRIVAFAAIISFIAVLAIRGIEQVFIEHPGIVENFKRNKDSILAANGWTPDSAMARGYERRLMQAEATGWFGLSNVYASFAAASSVAFGALAWITWAGRKAHRDRNGRETTPTSPWPLALSIAGFALSLGALALADSKGGFVTAAMGFVLAAGAMWIGRSNTAPLLATRLSRLAPGLGPALVAAALLAVIARGLVGERIGELSVLFRWFYMQAATRIAMDQPLLGVGPDGFKDAYLIFKNPLSPEEVGSPHSILFDWWACLGICGCAWIGLWLWWVARASTNLFTSAISTDSPSVPNLEARPLIRATSGIIILATLAAIWTETAALTPEAALIRIFGLGLWLVLAGGVVVIAIKHPRCVTALAAAAIMIAVHGQIEVTGSLPQSVGLFAAVIALAAARSSASKSEPIIERMWARGPAPIYGAVAAVGIVFVLNAGLLGWRGVWPAWQWERTLARAADRVRPIALARQWLDQAASESSLARRNMFVTEASEILSDALGRSVASEPREIMTAIRLIQDARIREAASILDGAANTDWRIQRERLRLRSILLSAADFQALEPTESDFRLWLADLDIKTDAARHEQSLAARYSMVSGVCEELVAAWRAKAINAPFVAVNLRGSFTARRATELDPYNLSVARRHLRYLLANDDHSDILVAARRVLELDDLQRLDRSVRGLTPAERREVEDLVKRLESAPKPTPTNP